MAFNLYSFEHWQGSSQHTTDTTFIQTKDEKSTNFAAALLYLPLMPTKKTKKIIKMQKIFIRKDTAENYSVEVALKFHSAPIHFDSFVQSPDSTRRFLHYSTTQCVSVLQ